MTLAANRYGKREVRLVKVTRHPGGSDLKQVTVNIFLQGDFESCYRAGDNQRILPTDTMKNAVYALARHSTLGSIEEFALELLQHFLANHPQVEEARIEMVETLWSRIGVDGRPHPAAFQQEGPETRTTAVTGTREGTSVSSGVDHLMLLKTSDSAFTGFIHDRFTTLAEAEDRLLGTEIRAEWRYAGTRLPFNDLWQRVLDTLKATFAGHKSLSVQHTLFEMGQQALGSVAEIEEIDLAMPNKHCLLVDLSPFGLDNPNQVFVPVDEPYGFIEARIAR
ncbi:MAG: factor-independent urate hydroxylase [Terriglobia bacterium]